MPERRYSHYRQADVWVQLIHLQKQLDAVIVQDTVHGSSVTIKRSGQEYRAVILARSSDWYYYSLNCTDRFRHGITCVICGTHDSCIDRPVLALDTMRWYEPKTIRNDFGPLQPKLDAQDHLIPDTFERYRGTQYGHNMFIGALMQRRPDALARLKALPPATRYRIEGTLNKLHKRRVGRPLLVWPVYKDRQMEYRT